MQYTPSRYQQDIYSWIKGATSGKSLTVQACAGSGKTLTCEKGATHIPDDLSVLSLAFNKHIATEMAKRMPEHVYTKTYHSLGRSAIVQAFGVPELDQHKVYGLCDRFLDRDNQKYLYYPVKRLVSLCKGNLLEPTNDNLTDLVNHHGVDLNSDTLLVFDTIRKIMKVSAEETDTIDFDDMCWLPIFHDLPMQKYGFVFVDELQDTNKVQTELVMKSMGKGANVVGVGDVFQSIYAFRGADSEAIPLFTKRLGADSLPLSITYRNPRLIVEMINERFPEIPMEHADWAIDGVINRALHYNRALEMFRPEDMILCRTNAPLVRPAFALIRKGIKAIIRGRDIGKGIKALAKRMKASDINDLFTKVRDYESRELSRLMRLERYSQAQAMQDKVDTLVALSDGCNTLYDLDRKIDTVFSDKNKGVVFSSIHKAKGLEAENVYILKPELLPHPSAKRDWERVQERNVSYVAFSRTLNTLTFVEGCP